MNYLGIDYGTRRIGLSVGDDDLRLALPIPCVHVSSLMEALEELVEIIQKRNIQKIIVGYPLNMDDTIGLKAREVDHFIEQLGKRVCWPMERVDERLTSESVGDMYHRSGKNRQQLRRRGNIDSAAAVIILQDYFDQICL